MRASLFFFAAVHAVALLTMLLLLRPGMDVAAFSALERARYVAENAHAWRLGWLPWQLSALSDLWVSVAFWRWARARELADARRFAGWALALFVVSAVPEQWAEASLVTSFVDSAANAAHGGLAAWQRDWAIYAAATGAWANFGYTVMTYYWMRCASCLLGRAVWPAWLERVLLTGFAVAGALTCMATLVASDTAMGAWFSAAGAVNGVAFPALIVWSLVLFRGLGPTR